MQDYFLKNYITVGSHWLYLSRIKKESTLVLTFVKALPGSRTENSERNGDE